ncbi:MAG: peptidyl-prolyl cis-trans isomerase [Rhodospirillaceae bacterium]|nr:peptidyl-prolyl cis-trans isomerase [Rhodospirillaceae bacterium]
MLQAIRGGVASWVVKILFAMLIVSFAIWGIGDIFRGAPPSTVVAAVGEQEIDATVVQDELRQQISRLQQLTNNQITISDTMRAGMIDGILRDQIEGALLDDAARGLGLDPSDDAIRQAIAADATFADPTTGAFSEDRFRQVLAFNRMGEAGFVALMRRNLRRALLDQAVRSVPVVPDVLVDAVFAAERERRVADLVTIDDAEVPIDEPSDDDLRAYHEEHADSFQAPEYRTFSLLTLAAEDLTGEVSVSEDEVRQLYEDEIDSFSQPERRRFDQALFPLDAEAEAQAFAEAVRGGADFAGALAEAGVSDVDSQPIDWTTQEDMFPSAIAEAGFALEPGQVSDPIASAFRIHVLRLDEVQEAGTQPFEEVRDGLEQRLRLDRALDTLFELSNGIDDALAGGATLEEAAPQVGTTVLAVPAVAVDGSFRDADAAVDVPDASEVLQTVFELAPDEESRLTESSDGHRIFVAKVDRIIAPELRDFDDAREEVLAAWQREARIAAARSAAEEAVTRLEAGDDPDAIAGDLVSATASRTDPLLPNSANEDQGVPAFVIDALFDLDEGGTTAVDGGGYAYAIRLVEVVPADPAEEADARAAIAERLGRDIASDFRATFLADQERRSGVRIDRDVLSRFLGEN